MKCKKCGQPLQKRARNLGKYPQPAYGLTRKEWSAKTDNQIKRIVSKALPRWEKQLLGELITERAAARRVVDDLIAYIVEKTKDGKELERPHLKECRNLIIEAFKETRMDTAEVSLAKLLMERLVPALQHIEKKIDITETHIVVLPEEKSEQDWGKVIDHDPKLLQ